MINLELHTSIVQKINNQHNVIENEVRQCFYNITNGFLIDDREDHRTDPPTLWFVAETDEGRLLKIICIHHKDRNQFILKSAYDANPATLALYQKLTRVT